MGRVLAMLSHALAINSIRKTRGYLLYQQTKGIGRVMKMLKHRGEETTLRYIGIAQEAVDKDFINLEI